LIALKKEYNLIDTPNLGGAKSKIVASHTFHPPAASEPTNRRTKPESHKHQQERSITNRSGQQHPGEIAAGGPATSEGLPGAKTRDAWGRTLMKSPRENKEDAAAMVIEANRELTPPSCLPLSHHRIYQHPPRHRRTYHTSHPKPQLRHPARIRGHPRGRP